MAQSRMAGMAMDLGPSDLADVGEAATLATNKMGMEQGNTAAALVSLDSNRLIRKNDGYPVLKIQKGKDTVTLTDPSFANPVTNKPAGGGYLDGQDLTPEERAYFGQYF